MPKPFNVFISYSHDDFALRKELDAHLSTLKDANIINVWTDSDISPGTEWEAQIDQQLEQAQIILLLVSADFLSSSFCQSREMAKAIARHNANTARVIPIIVRKAFWEITKFGKLQALPLSSDNRPLPVMSWERRDEAWANVAQGIYDIANELEQKEHVVRTNRKQRQPESSDPRRMLTLFISSPVDMAEERQIVHHIVQQLNQDEAIGRQAEIAIASSDERASLDNGSPQIQNFHEGIKPSECDIVVVILGSQIDPPPLGNIVREDGTTYDSQIEWEYEDAALAAKRHQGRPTVLLYRNNQSIMIRPGDANLYEKIEQWQKVERFFARFIATDTTLQKKYHPYEGLKQFAALLEEHLCSTIEVLLKEAPSIQSEQRSESETVIPDDVGELLKPYLDWLIEQHSRLELRGLGGDDRLPTIPLEKVYVALKGHRASSYEREQSLELLRAEIPDLISQLSQLKQELTPSEFALALFDAERRAIISNPFTSSPLITLGDAFRQERWMVILGDPGSGKTTLARWITLKLASALLNEESSVVVPAYQVDPKIGKSDTSTVDIGPARLPVLLRVSEFAEAYQKARQNLETLSIADFLGKHSWLGQAPNLPKPQINALIKHYLRMGRAVIILDGMDEITIANQREDVVRAIEVFINDWINGQGKNISTAEKSSLWHDPAKKEPAKTGGNQIIITSRIVGYHTRPIDGHVARITIQPMQQVAIEHFCDAWTFATQQLLSPEEPIEAIQSRADAEAEGLKKAIFDPLRPRISELASNPLLITILALIYRRNQGRLPEQRTALYSKALDILIEGWRITGMKTKELTYVLSPLAAHIHQYSSSGLIDKAAMKEIITEALAQYRQVDSLDLPPAFELEVDAFIRCVCEDIGLLSETGERNYSFLHLTFQEYLAALYLIRDVRNAPQAIITRLDDPRWREPILMALGHISIHWGPNARHLLLTTLLNSDDSLGDLIPRSALLIASAIPEMTQISEDIIHEIIRRLLTTYADHDGVGNFSTLHKHISSSLNNLYKSHPYQQCFEQYLETIILNIESGNRNLALASAPLIAENKWDNDTLLKALIKAYPYDDPAWEYPITRTLLLRHKSLPVAFDTLPLRKALEAEPELVEYIQNNLTWLRLIILLYGGISDNDLTTYAVQYDELVRVFALKGPARQHYIDQLKTRDYWRENWNKDDMSEVVYQIAVYLDTECIHHAEKAIKHIPEFTAQAVLNDSPLTKMLLSTLRQKQPPSTLKSRLWREWHAAKQNVLRVHALLALLIIDPQQAVDTLTSSFHNTATFPLATLALNQLRQRKHTLTHVLIILGKKEQIGQSLQPLQELLQDDQWGDLVDIFYRTFTSVMHRPVHYDTILLEKAPSLPRLNAEIWAEWLSGLSQLPELPGGDPLYNYAVVLDTQGKYLKSAPALINIQFAHNRQYNEFTRWRPLTIPPAYDTYSDIVGEALTIAHQSSSEAMKYLFHAGMITFMGIDYQDHPDLQADALAATLLIIPAAFQAAVIQSLDATLLQLSAHELTRQVVQRVLAITDPVIRSRALWRLGQYTYRQNFNFRELAIEAAEHIVDPLHRSRAFERLIRYVPSWQRELLKDKALEAARNITDANNRARSFARLALYENDARRWSLFSDALQAARAIIDEQQLVETLQMLHPHLVENEQLIQEYNDIIKHIQRDWYRSKGQNLLSLQLLALHEQLHEPQSQTPVILASLIDDLVTLKPQETTSEDLWRQLLEPERRTQAISALLKIAAVNDLEGLHLTPNVVDVIRSLLDTQEIATIYSLLPYLRGAEPSLLSSLSSWVDNPPDPLLWAYAGLLLAEAGQVNPSTIPCLLELIENGIDIGRYRASIVLHGSHVVIGKTRRDFSTSQLGLQSLLLLAQAHKRLLAEKEPAATSIGWICCNIAYDDPILLQQLIDYANAEEGNEGGASSLLRNISYCTNDVLEAIVNQFEHGSEKTQELLLDSWLSLFSFHFEQNITPAMKERIVEVISKMPKDRLKNIQVIPNRLLTIGSLLSSVSRQVEEEQITLQQAIITLNQQLSMSSLRLPDTPVEELTEQAFYKLETDPHDALQIASAISENSTSLELLFAWLAASLSEDLDDVPISYYRTPTLLELAGATTHFSPAAIYRLLEKHRLGPVLVQATIHHSSFWGRAGAATLLGYLRHTPASFDEALFRGLHDVAEVQTAIVQMVQNLRYLDKRLIPTLIDMLAHKSASVVYTVAKLLVSIARDEKTPQSQREKIVKALNTIRQHQDSLRPVFVLENDAGRILVHNIGRLDQQLYSDNITISGII